MKKLTILGLPLLFAAGMMYGQAVTLTIDAGLLENTIGTAVEPAGGLLQLIASPSGTFSAPTSTSYVTGDNVLISSFAASYTASQISGETLTTTAYPLTTSSYNLTTGESVLLRFYPSLTAANTPASPTLGTTYGQVRSSTIEFPTDGSETAWVIPASGVAADLNYITLNDGGTYSNLSAQATNVVLAGVATGVPEPSAYVLALIGIAAIGTKIGWGKRVS